MHIQIRCQTANARIKMLINSSAQTQKHLRIHKLTNKNTLITDTDSYNVKAQMRIFKHKCID